MKSSNFNSFHIHNTDTSYLLPLALAFSARITTSSCQDEDSGLISSRMKDLGNDAHHVPLRKSIMGGKEEGRRRGMARPATYLKTSNHTLCGASRQSSSSTKTTRKLSSLSTVSASSSSSSTASSFFGRGRNDSTFLKPVKYESKVSNLGTNWLQLDTSSIRYSRVLLIH